MQRRAVGCGGGCAGQASRRTFPRLSDETVGCRGGLSDAAAAALAKHEGGLSLGGLTSLSDAAAAAQLGMRSQIPTMSMMRPIIKDCLIRFRQP
jgi:hypothetical protein